MPTDRCPTCDRPLASAAALAEWNRGSIYCETIEARDGVCLSPQSDCCNERAIDWRARALGLDALLAEERHIAAQTTARLDTILGKLGARDTGNGGQTIEAGDTRIFNDGMRRLDRAIADAARWRKVAPLIERLADDVRRRELIARAEFDRRVSDTVTALLAATQEPTP